MIHWEKETTITNTYQMHFRLRVMETVDGTSQSYDASEEHVIRAIEESPELREAVDKQRIPWAQGLQKAHDEWKARAEKAEENYRFMVEQAADQKLDGYRELGARLAASEEARDAAESRLREAERERDEARAEAAEARRILCAVVSAIGGVASTTVSLEFLANVPGEVSAKIAKLERELAEARGAAPGDAGKRIAHLENELAAAMGDVETWKNYGKYMDSIANARHDTIERLERELATVHDTDAAPWNMSRADAEELAAWRKVATWLNGKDTRRLECKRRELILSDLGIAAWHPLGASPSIVELARRLGLMGDEGAGKRGPDDGPRER